MSENYIQARIRMYQRVKDFSLAFHVQFRNKKIKFISQRLQEHVKDLDFLYEIYNVWDTKESREILSRVNLRLEEMNLASEIVHRLEYSNYAMSETDPLYKLIKNMVETRSNQERVFCHYMRIFLSRLNRQKSKKRVPVELLEELNNANRKLAALLEQTAGEVATSAREYKGLYETLQGMDDRLAILDRLMENYKESDMALYEAYFIARQANTKTIVSENSWAWRPS